MTRTVRFLALERNEAKQVFQTKEPAPLGALIENLWNDPTRAADRKLDTNLDAAGYFAQIEQTASLDDSAKSLLTRGGRQLPSNEGAALYLLRPDLIGPLSLAANSLATLATFLASAASRGEAIVIVF